MEIHNDIKEIHSDKDTALTIGKFEGIHLGHQEVFRMLSHYAYGHQLVSTVISFLNDPKDIIGDPGHLEKMIYPLKDRVQFIKECGISRVVFIPFNKQVAEIPAEAFIETIILERMKARYMICSEDFRFGKKRKGDVLLLKKLCGKQDCMVEIAGPCKVDGEKVSSSVICRLIRDGEFEKASKLLGRRYFIDGEVKKGRGVGRELGFPTLNISYPDEVLIPQGVFAGNVEIEGTMFPAVVNSGKRPTLYECGRNVVEIHILSEDVPHRIASVKLYPVENIRSEKKFRTKEDLINQIRKDCERARAILLKM